MHYDDVCLAGTGCILSQGNRNLADFFVVNIDNTGAAEIVYDDTSNKLVQPPGTCTVQVADHCGAGVITIARQASGIGLFGTKVTGPSNAPVGGMTDASGDGLYPVIGGLNQSGMDVPSSRLGLSPDAPTLTVTIQVHAPSHPPIPIPRV